MILIINISYSSNLNKFLGGIFTRQGPINQVYQMAVMQWLTRVAKWSDSGPIKRKFCHFKKFENWLSAPIFQFIKRPYFCKKNACIAPILLQNWACIKKNSAHCAMLFKQGDSREQGCTYCELVGNIRLRSEPRWRQHGVEQASRRAAVYLSWDRIPAPQ